MQYDSNPKYTKSQNWNKFRRNYPIFCCNNRLSQIDSSFEEARRRKECQNCGACNWNPLHWYEKRYIAAYTRSSLINGDSSVHIVADFLQKIEWDIGGFQNEEPFGILYNSKLGEQVAEYDAFSTQIQENILNRIYRSDRILQLRDMSYPCSFSAEPSTNYTFGFPSRRRGAENRYPSLIS